ncbi:PRC-barrel domain containing protein [Rhizobium lusitanum]|uniref:PRC-barrel domain containing protein n=1 Tax=Rhizobium lusitanum TaxID=293958 RepID=A0A6L9UBC6_9HYPH|nr:PRC-barrel domain-containing protein [Rhizobium lusitanum]NEI73223.1 PRC-barrel domain containing protein [Rhizobium lusitanum]
MDYSNHVRLSPHQLNAGNLEGAAVYGVDDRKVGKIDHVHGSGMAATVVIDVGGFLEGGAKPVAVSIGDLNVIRDEGGYVHAVTSWTKDQLKHIPEHRD